MRTRKAQFGAILLAVALVLSSGAAVLLAGEAVSPTPPGALSGSAVVPPLAAPSYAVSFVESGLPNGTWWSATLDNQTKTTPGESTITFPATNGTYNFTITSVGYIADPASGSIRVVGNSRTVRIAFSNHTETYPVEFTESGLPSGTNWGVAVNGSAQNSNLPTIGFTEANGTYGYVVEPIAGYLSQYSGTVLVNGSALEVPVVFSPATYSVTFTETGLPGATNWTVDLGDERGSSTGPTIAFSEPNGTYDYLVEGVPGFVTTYRGNLTVNGSALGLSINFTIVLYPIVLTEAGLPSGGGWTASVGGVPKVSTTPEIVFEEPNGSYAVTFGAGPDYQVSPAEIGLLVEGAGTSAHVTFTAIPFDLNFTETGLSGGTWSVTVNGTTISAAAGSPIAFLLDDGTYPYSLGAIAGYTTQWTGAAVVAGANQTIAVTFHPVTYIVRLTASGVPTGTPWRAAVGAQSANSSASAIAFRLPNGTYSVSTLSLSDSWQTLAPFGSLNVTGSNVLISIPFAYAYPATFDAANLPSGVTWTVNLTGSLATPSAGVVAAAVSTFVQYSYTSAQPTLEVPLPNGTYQYTVHTNSLSWTPAITPSTLTVAGAPPPPQTVAPSTSPGPSTGISSTFIAVIAAVALVAIVLVGAVTYRQVARRGSGSAGIDELYGAYELATDVDLGGGPPPSDPLDDIF